MLGDDRLALLEHIFSTEEPQVAHLTFREPFSLPSGENADEGFLMFLTVSRVGETIFPSVYEVVFTFRSEGNDCAYRIRWTLFNDGDTFLFRVDGGLQTLVYDHYRKSVVSLSKEWNLEQCEGYFEFLLELFAFSDSTRLISNDSTELAAYIINKNVFLYGPGGTEEVEPHKV